MDSIRSIPGLNPPGRLGLVIGFPSKPIQIQKFSEIPPVSSPLPNSLPELLQSKIQENFTIKDWLLQHAIQANKLLLPCTQILGIYTSSPEQIIESKPNPVCSEIADLLKRIQKQLKIEELIHYHQDLTNKAKPAARIYNFFNVKNSLCSKIEEKHMEFVQIKGKLAVCLDFDSEVNDFSEVFQQFSEFVDKLIVRFPLVESGQVLARSQNVSIYSNTLGKVLDRPKMRFKGVVETRVVVPTGTNVDLAAGFVKKDLIKTIQDRFSIVKKNVNSVKQGFWLPRRVFFVGGFVNCDYLVVGEGEKQARERMKMLLGGEDGVFEEYEKLNGLEIKVNRDESVSNSKVNIKIFTFLIISIIIAFIFTYIV